MIGCLFVCLSLTEPRSDARLALPPSVNDRSGLFVALEEKLSLIGDYFVFVVYDIANLN